MTRSSSTSMGEFSPRSNSFRTTVISLSRSFLATKEFTMRSASNLEWALDLEADRMVNSFVAKKDLDSEMTVVRNEFERGENSPMDVLEERVMSTAFLDRKSVV